MFFGGTILFPEGVVPPNPIKIFSSLISTDIKKHWHPMLSRSKNDVFGGHLGVPGRVVPRKYVKVFVSSFPLDIKDVAL